MQQPVFLSIDALTYMQIADVDELVHITIKVQGGIFCNTKQVEDWKTTVHCHRGRQGLMDSMAV